MSDEESSAPETAAAPALLPDPTIRCICSRQFDDMGMMICCDKCEMWAHCICYGISQVEVPDTFFCTVCKPAAPKKNDEQKQNEEMQNEEMQNEEKQNEEKQNAPRQGQKREREDEHDVANQFGN